MIRRLLTIITAAYVDLFARLELWNSLQDYAYSCTTPERYEAGSHDIRKLCRWHFKRIRQGRNEQSERALLKHAIERLHVPSAEIARARLWLEVSR
jgi:hypothetical protein